jgi:hypothetical protein
VSALISLRSGWAVRRFSRQRLGLGGSKPTRQRMASGTASIRDQGAGLPATFDDAQGAGLGIRIVRGLITQTGANSAFTDISRDRNSSSRYPCRPKREITTNSSCCWVRRRRRTSASQPSASTSRPTSGARLCQVAAYVFDPSMVVHPFRIVGGIGKEVRHVILPSRASADEQHRRRSTRGAATVSPKPISSEGTDHGRLGT